MIIRVPHITHRIIEAFFTKHPLGARVRDVCLAPQDRLALAALRVLCPQRF